MLKICILVALVWGIYYLIQKKHRPTLLYSAAPFLQKYTTLKTLLHGLILPFFLAALFFFGLAWLHPEYASSLSIKPELSRQGVALYILIDESGSMQEEVVVEGGGHEAKITWVKQVAKKIIEERKNDLIGLVKFARIPEIVCPLTIDRQELLSKLVSITIVPSDDLEGTAIGYALLKTVNLILSAKHYAELQRELHKPVYTIESQAIIILTDGLQSPHPDDLHDRFRSIRPQQAADFAAVNHVPIFFIGVDPVILESQFIREVQEIKDAVTHTGGAFFVSDTLSPLPKIYEKLDTLKKSTLAPEIATENPPTTNLQPLFIIIGLVFLFGGCLLETLFARSCP